MPDSLLQLLQATQNPAEKAALIADAILDELPAAVALTARRCIILHWFDLPIVKALLQDAEFTESYAKEVYEQLVSLPFIESLTWGLTFQDLTREGLLEHYAKRRPEMLRTAASLAAPVYATHKAVEAAVGEALFCYIVAGDAQASRTLLNQLLEQAIDQQDWRYGQSVLQLQEEAEQLPFVEPLPLNEYDWMIRGLFHTVHGKLEIAIADYSRAIEIAPSNTIAYISRGNIYAEQQMFEGALSEYNSVLQIDPTIVQAYMNRGVIYTKSEHYTDALVDFDHALQLAPRSIFALRNKCLVLCRLAQFEEAEAVYKQILRLEPIPFTVDRSHTFPAQQNAEQEATMLLPEADLSHVSFAQPNLASASQRIGEPHVTEESGEETFPDLEPYKNSPNHFDRGSRTPLPLVSQDTVALSAHREKKRKNSSRGIWAILAAACLLLLLSLASVLFYTLPSTSIISIKPKGTQNPSPSIQSTSPKTPTPALKQLSPTPRSTAVGTSTVGPTPTAASTSTPRATPTPTAALTPPPTADPTPTVASTPSPMPSATPVAESLTVPFISSGVSTVNSYRGTVTISVSGIGQALQTQDSDAFYIFTDNAGNPITPVHPTCWVLNIDGQPTDNFLSPPPYDASHSYTFQISVPAGPLTFDVCDPDRSDNTGQYNITVTQN